MSLPEQLLLSELLRRRVRCDQGLDHGVGVAAWMHPPVHRLLGWFSKPSALGDRRQVWRLNQLCGLAELELFVRGDAAPSEIATMDRLPTLIEATVLGQDGEPLGQIADAAVDLSSGQILHYLVSRSDPRLPGTSRWRLAPARIDDQQPGTVFTALAGLDDLPLAKASVRQEFLRRSKRWREQMQEETSRWRDQVQNAGERFEERLEGWLEEPPWDGQEPDVDRPSPGQETWDDWNDSDLPPPRRRQQDDPWI